MDGTGRSLPLCGSLYAGPRICNRQNSDNRRKTIKTFFELAICDMGFRADRVAMIGDDILTDIDGARIMGMQGILVRTGKYRKDAVDIAGVKPSCIIDSIAGVWDIL